MVNKKRSGTKILYTNVISSFPGLNAFVFNVLTPSCVVSIFMFPLSYGDKGIPCLCICVLIRKNSITLVRAINGYRA